MAKLAVTVITLGAVTFYNAELRRDGDVEFYISDSSVLRDGIIQNNSRSVVVSRGAWDSMAAAAVVASAFATRAA